MSLVTSKPAYSIADGDHSFDAVQAEHTVISVNMGYSNVVATDVRAELHQSIDGTNFNTISGSNVPIDASKPSHIWNVEGLPVGTFIRVKIFKGSAAAGTIDRISTLS